MNFKMFMRSAQLIGAGKLLSRLLFYPIFFLSLCAAAPAPRTVLFLGDSITAGYDLDTSQAFPALIQKKIDARGWNFRVINAGQSGDTSAGGLSRLDWLLKNRIDVLVLELGANDAIRGLPLENTKKNLQAIIDRTKERYPEATIIIAGMKIPPNMGTAYGRRFEAVFRELAKENRAALIPFILEGVAAIPKFNLPDGVHPTAEGHEIIAANVWKALEPILRSLVAKEATKFKVPGSKFKVLAQP